MSISSGWPSPFFSCNDVTNNISSNSNPLLSTEDPFLLSYHTNHEAHRFNFAHSGNSKTPAGLLNPPLVQTFCNSSPMDGQIWNRIPESLTTDKRNHKMIERQRRKEMNVLLSRLRSLLPEENLRGKRTMSQQVLQRKIEDLSAEREKIKVNSDQNAKFSLEKIFSKTPPLGGSGREYPALKIISMGSGVQIWTNTLEHEIVFSDILLALEEGGLEVVSAASSAIKNKVYHTIHTKGLSFVFLGRFVLFTDQ